MNPPLPAPAAATGRRGFIRTLGLGAAAPAVLAPGPVRSASASRVSAAKNVLFYVSDGMNIGTLSLADLYSREFLGRRDPWLQLYLDRPETARGLMDMASDSSPVTDSAAAASSWSCGRRVPNGALNHDGEGKRLEPLYETLARHGKATGLVTTARATHATPAGFAAAVRGRSQEDDIAVQYRELGVDVILGGGLPHFTAGRRADGADLLGGYRADGYHVALDRDSLLAAPGAGRLLGLFAESHVPYEIDRHHDETVARAVPSLAEMTAAALARLEASPQGFVVQIEGARVDHAGHANDLGAILHDQIAFGEALQAGLKWAEGRDDTLVVICTDHGCGGPNLNGAGSGYKESGPRFARIEAARGSIEALVPLIQHEGSGADRAQAAASRLGYEPGKADATALAGLMERLAAEDKKLTPELLSPVLSPFQSGPCAVTWNSNSHTGDLVEIAALGPGAGHLPRFLDNTFIRPWLLASLGLE